MVCGTFADADGEYSILLREDALDLVERLLASDITLVGVNIVFDMAVVIANRPRLLVPVFRAFQRGRILSCDVIEKLRKIARGMNKFDYVHKRKPRYSLAELVDEYLGEQVSGKKGQDAWRLRYKELDGVPLEDWPAEAKDYAVDDARYTARVFLKQQEATRGDVLMAQTLVDLHRQMMASFGLYMMRVWGFRADSLATDMLDKELHDHVDSELEYLLSTGLYKEKITKKRTGVIERKLSKNMKMLYDTVQRAYDVKEEPVPMTDGGKGPVKKPKVKTDAETLINSLDPNLRRLADIMGDKKLMDTYVPILRKGTRWPINPFYNVMVDSGRTSCSGPNIQNQPRKGGVRECFVPMPGYVYVGCDYHTAELRALAQYCLSVLGVSEMADAFKHTEKYPHGKDLHLVMAAALLNISYDEAEKRKKERVVKDARQLSKVLNFGLPGGLGPQKFIDFAWKSYGMKLAPTNSEAVVVAKQLKKQWIAAFPEMQLFFNSINAQLSGAEGFTAQALKSNRLRGNVGYCDGCNQSFQGLTADGAKLAVWAVVLESWTGWKWDEEIPDTYDLGPSPLLGFRPNGFVHDEIIGESPLALFRQHAKRLAEVMKEAMCWFVTDVPVEADAHAMRRWWKDAEPVYNDQGVLQIWGPEDPYVKLAKKDPNHPLLQKWWNDDDVAALEEQFPHSEESKEPSWRTIFRAHTLDSLAKYRTGEEEMPTE